MRAQISYISHFPHMKSREECFHATHSSEGVIGQEEHELSGERGNSDKALFVELFTGRAFCKMSKLSVLT